MEENIKRIIDNPNYRIRLTMERWNHIISAHPELADKQNVIESTLHRPEQEYRGPKGEIAAFKNLQNELNIVVYYRPVNNRDAFVLTAHIITSRRARRKFKKWKLVKGH